MTDVELHPVAKFIIFDWGDTLMRDFREFSGPMAHWPKVEVLPGVPEALEQLRGQYSLVVASGAGVSGAGLMHQAMDRVGIGRFFQQFFTAKELGAPKPSEEFFQAICRRTNCSPAECVMVGNDYARDICGANAAGMRTIWLTDSASCQEPTAADAIISSMSELPQALERLCRPADAAVKEQYRTPANLDARATLQGRFSTNKQGLGRWAFGQYDLPAECRILELGCGSGWLWRANRERIKTGWQIILSDLSAGMVAESRQNVADLGRQFRFVQCRAEEIGLGDATFDTAIANHMLYHVTNLPQALAELRRVLKTTGVLYATTNGLTHMRDLANLLRQFDSRIDYGLDRVCRPFMLENGQEQLSRHFRHVRMIPFDDCLEVTEVEPLVAYVMSLSGMSNTCQVLSEELDRFRQFIDGRIRAEGAVRIGKSVGMFVASNARPNA